MQRRVSWVLVLLAACACAGTPSRTTEPVEAASSNSARTSVELLAASGPRYVLRPGRPEQPKVHGLLVDGQRFAMVDGKLTQSAQSTTPALLGSVDVPPEHGGGFLFHNGRRLFRASSFIADLQTFADAGGDITGVQFGPGFVLLDTTTGRVTIDEASGSTRSLPVPGLEFVGTDAKGNALAVTTLGDALFAPAGGRWVRVNDQLPSPAVGVRRQGDVIAFDLLSVVAVTFDADGHWVTLPSNPVWPDPRWRGQEVPLVLAVERGVPLPGNRAAVMLNDSLVVIDLESGQASPLSSKLVPGSNDCQLLEAEPEPLLVCAGYEGLSIVRTPVSAPAVERNFANDALLAYASGFLVIDRSCEDKKEPGLACVRDAAGTYVELDLTKELEATFGPPSAEMQVNISWFASTEGAFAFVTSPSPAFVNPRSRTVVKIAEANWDEVRRIVPFPRTGQVMTTVLATPSDAIVLRGFDSSRQFAIGLDGRDEPSAQRFNTLTPFGARALASQGASAFESVDYGKTWTEIQPGPGVPNSASCSAVGCANAYWLRLGWGPQAPHVVSRPEPLLMPTTVSKRALPTLRCREASPPEVKPAGPATQVNGVTRDLGFGARMLTLGTNDRAFFRQLGRWRWQTYMDPLVALVYGTIPQTTDDPMGGTVLTQGELGRAKSIFFTRPFDPKGEVRTASISWRAQYDIARRFGSPSPGLYPYDQSDLMAVPVVDAKGITDGMVLVDDSLSLFWVHDSGAVEPIALGPDATSLELLAAASVRGELRLLVRYGAGQNRIVRAGRAALETLTSPPGEPQGLSVFADGSVAPVYGSVGSEPASKEDPVFVGRDRGMVAMPPWATLKLATAPECAPSAADAVTLLRADRSWFDLEMPTLNANGESEEQAMMALVRFDERRLCLQAVEIAGSHASWGDNGENMVGIRVAARFDERGGAGKVGIELGGEYRQALSCTLEP